MTAHPRVSVICIFLDGEAFLAEALDSVLAQDFNDFELLLVDDGSTDSSTAIAKDYARRLAPKVRYLEHDGHANRGMSASRNLGLSNASGELVAFIDADDRWRPGKLAEQAEILDGHPEVAMICGTVNYWRSWQGGRDQIIPTGHVRDEKSEPPETLLAVYPLGMFDAPCPSDVMVRRSAVEAVGRFEEQFRGLYEDLAFFVKIFASAPVWFSSRIWLDYRQHRDSASSTVGRQRYRQIRRYFLDWLSAYIATQPIALKARIERSIALARWELDHPRLGRVVRRLRRSLRRFVPS